MTDSEMLAMNDYKYYPYGYFKKYISVWKYYKKRGYEWMTIDQSGGTGARDIPYPDIASAFRIKTDNYAAGSRIGHFKITWYVKFRMMRMS